MKAPGFSDRREEMLKDIAVLKGAQAITEDLGLKLEGVTLKDLGRAKRMTRFTPPAQRWKKASFLAVALRLCAPLRLWTL